MAMPPDQRCARIQFQSGAMARRCWFKSNQAETLVRGQVIPVATRLKANSKGIDMRLFVDSDGIFLHTFGGVLSLKTPKCRVYFSERYRAKTTVIPLGFGWRVNWRR